MIDILEYEWVEPKIGVVDVLKKFVLRKLWQIFLSFNYY